MKIMRKIKQVAALGLALMVGLTPVAYGGEAERPINDKVLVVAVEATFEEKWNPFIAESSYDREATDQIFTPIMSLDANNELIPWGGNVSVQENEDGTVLYTVTVNEGMTFSDGEPVTIDDYIYGLYVRSDPSYAGRPSSTLGGFIEGVPEYFYDNPNYSADIAAIEEEMAARYAPDVITLEDFTAYALETNLAGWWSGDPAGEAAAGLTWEQYIIDEGFEAQLAEIDKADPAAMLDLLILIEFTNYLDGYDDILNYMTEKAKSEYALTNLEGGTDVPEISGITKIDDYTCTIKYTNVSIVGDRELTVKNGLGNLIPEHYYGEITKGDVSSIIANLEPMGSGPYKWVGFSDNIVTAIANPLYFKGEPKIGTVRWQFIPQMETIPALASGAVDIAVPSSSLDNVAELTALGQRYDLVTNAGYGFMGMNTDCVPLDVRRGFWSLMNRPPAIESYYGELAIVIERPMSTILAEYPDEAQPYYEYSRDKALEYFNAAGYTQNAEGLLVNEAGEQLVLNVYIGGEGEGLHPAYPMMVQAAEDMASMGAELQIQDVQFAILNGAMNDGTADAWVMAWGEVFDCDKSTQFHSTGGQNRYNFKDQKMDDMLDEIVQTLDFDERAAKVAEMLDYAMDQAIELPLYQRQNMIAYNTQTLNMDTIPASTPFFDYKAELYQVDLLQ